MRTWWCYAILSVFKSLQNIVFLYFILHRYICIMFGLSAVTCVKVRQISSGFVGNRRNGGPDETCLF